MPLLSLQKLFDSLSRSERSEIIAESGLQGIAGEIDVKLGPDQILRAILRRKDVPNETFAELIKESNLIATDQLGIPAGQAQPSQLAVTMAFPASTVDNGLPVTNIAKGTAMSWEVLARLAAVYRDLSSVTAMPPPPKAAVSSGSLKLIFSDSPILAALALIMRIPLGELQTAPTRGGVFVFNAMLMTYLSDWETTVIKLVKESKSSQLAFLQEIAGDDKKGVPASGVIQSAHLVSLAKEVNIPVVLAMQLVNKAGYALGRLHLLAGKPTISVSLSGGASATLTASAS